MSDRTSFSRASAGDMTVSPLAKLLIVAKPSPAGVLQQAAGAAWQSCSLSVGFASRRRDRQQAGNAAAADVIDSGEHHVVALDLHHHRRSQALAVEFAQGHREVGRMAVPADGKVRTERDLRGALRTAYRDLPLVVPRRDFLPFDEFFAQA